ncbi:hypothetical protein HDU98_001490, partial [Podochytrium sp. JEL0797]
MGSALIYLALLAASVCSQTTSPAPSATATPAPATNGTVGPTTNGTVGLAIGATETVFPSGPAPRWGAAAHWIADQGVVLFVGGVGGTWNTPVALPVGQTVTALSLRNDGFTPQSATWLQVPQPVVANVPVNAVNPLQTSYGVSVVARSTDLGIQGKDVHVLYYLFGNSPNPNTAAVYQLRQKNPSTIQTYNSQPSSADSRVRSASCLITPTDMIIHGGSSGADNTAESQTLQTTYFLNLPKSTTTTPAWTLKLDSSNDPDLHDHAMECVEGVAYMVGGITGDYNLDGSLVGARMDVVWVFQWGDDLKSGVWVNRTVFPDPVGGYPPVRRSHTLTAVSPTSNLLLLHGGVAPDLSVSYSDLWQLDTTTFTWHQLPSAPLPRHSHNAVLLSNHLLIAFGVISNISDPSPPTLPLVTAFDLTANQWTGTIPRAVAFGEPAPLPPHVGPKNSASPSLDAGDPPSPKIPLVAIYASAGALVAIIAAVAGVMVARRKRKVMHETYLHEQKMVRQLYDEDMDRRRAFEGVIGVEGGVGREVGGELAKVIRMNQTGVREEEGVEEKGVERVGVRASYTTDLTYPSGLTSDVEETTDEEEEEASEEGSRVGVKGSAVGGGAVGVGSTVGSVGVGTKKPPATAITTITPVAKLSQFVETVRSSSRNSAFP